MSQASLDSPFRPTPVVAPRAAMALTHAPVGSRLIVVSVDEATAAELAREGFLPGSRIEVIDRVPFGGPLIVELGRVRLALGSTAAAGIRVVPLSEGATDRAASAHG